jgi:hypothetical protein
MGSVFGGCARDAYKKLDTNVCDFIEVPTRGKIPLMLTLGGIVMAETPIGTQAADPMLSTVEPPTSGLISQLDRPVLNDDADRLRGVVALPHQRSILFTDEVELDVGTLPRNLPPPVAQRLSIGLGSIPSATQSEPDGQSVAGAL